MWNTAINTVVFLLKFKEEETPFLALDLTNTSPLFDVEQGSQPYHLIFLCLFVLFKSKGDTFCTHTGVDWERRTVYLSFIQAAQGQNTAHLTLAARDSQN